MRANFSFQFRFHSGVGEEQIKPRQDASQVLHG
jgi:hypothetical protein